MKKIIIFSFMILIVFLLLCGRFVSDDGMNPTFYDGDFVIVLPCSPQIGDIVVVQDPLHRQGNVFLRRLIATEGMDIAYDRNGSLVHNGYRITQRDMGVLDRHRVIEERFEHVDKRIQTWKITRLVEPINTVMPAQEIPLKHLFLLSGKRDEAIDSRIWGPVHKDLIRGVVWIRIGVSDPWRSWFSWKP